MISHNDKFVIPIQGLLMEEQPIVLNYQISIELFFTECFNVYNQLATFEGYRSIDQCYKCNKLCGTENHIYTYYFNEYKTESNYIINTLNDIPIYGVITTVKSHISPNQPINIKFGGIDMISCSNPYFEHNNIMIPIDNAYSYISRPPSLNLPALNSVTGLVFGNDNLKIDVISDQPINIEVLYIINNVLRIDGFSKNVNVMVPTKYHKLMHEPSKGSPLYKVNDTEFIEGYWANPSCINDSDRSRFKYNLPIETNIRVDTKFMEKLNNMINNGDCDSTHYNGFSACRVCNKANGSREFKLSNGHISFRFPEGLLHYYNDHNVQPSEQFYYFIMNL